MNLLLFEPTRVGPDGRVRLGAEHVAHLREVLHVSPGDAVRVGVLDGPLGTGIVTGAVADQIELQCTFDGSVPDPPRVDLLLAVPRPKVMRRLWAHLSALGVGRVILTNAEKVERDYFGSHALEEQTYRPLLIEGLQQARDTRVPVVSIHKRFRVLVEDELDRIGPHSRRIVAHPASPGYADRSLSSALDGIGPDDRVLLAVGPEGGWNDFELHLLEHHRFQRVAIGPRTLATTTACIALLALLHDALRAR